MVIVTRISGKTRVYDTENIRRYVIYQYLDKDEKYTLACEVDDAVCAINRYDDIYMARAEYEAIKDAEAKLQIAYVVGENEVV